MIILSNCLTDKPDEGCLKVANNMVKRIRKKRPDTMLITYGTRTVPSDRHFRENKFMLNGKLLWLLWRKKEPVLFVPAVAKAHSLALRIFILSLFATRGISVVQVMKHDADPISRMLMKLSRAKMILFSRDSWQYYERFLAHRAIYLKTGVDVQRYHPVTKAEQQALRSKYQLPLDKKLVLHVGHMQTGRNVEKLTQLDSGSHGVLVISTYAPGAQNQELRQRLLANPNITVIDTYLPNIEELYQLADVYLFPVVAEHSCIDVPLSAMEAAACNLPVVATPYGELKELLGKDGFYELRSFEPAALNRLLQTACEEQKEPRPQVLAYDWDRAVEQLLMSTEVL